MKTPVNNEEKVTAQAVIEFAGSTKRKLALAGLGTFGVVAAYFFLFTEGVGNNFVAMAWLGTVLAAPFGYDLLCVLLNRSK